MTTIHVGPAKCQLVASTVARLEIKDALSFRVKGFQYSPAYRSGHWDGRQTLLSRDGTFSSGLLKLVENALRDAEIPFTCEALEVPEVVLNSARWGLLVELRDYQEEAVKAALEGKRGIFEMATGTGKTEVMIAITAALGLRTLVLVNNRDLALQTAQRFSARLAGAKVGVIGAGRRELRDITIATFQSLRSWIKRDAEQALKALRTYDVVHSDECHTLPAKTYVPVILSIPAQYRFGWSATPFKEDDKRAELQLIGATGPVLMELQPKEAVRTGTSVPTSVTMLQWRQSKPMTTWGSYRFDVDDAAFESYAALYRRAIIESDERNDAIVEAAQALAQSGRPTLILVTSIPHGEALSRTLGVPFAHGSSSMEARKHAVQSLRDGSEQLVIASVIFDQGVDVPELSGLVIAGGGKAHHVVVQRVGRGSRPSKGKDRLEVVDFFDTHSRTLWRHSKARLKAYKDLGADVEVIGL